MNLFQFIKELSPDEIGVISTAFRRKTGAENTVFSKETDFFNHVISTPLEDLDDRSVKEHLGKKENAYNKLKGRVLTKILEKICSESFIKNDGIIDGLDRAEVRVKKKLLQAKILNSKKSKSNPELFLHLINEVVEESKEYELYNSLVDALTYRKHYYANRLSFAEFEKIEAEIDHYRGCAQAANEAQNAYFRIISNQKLIAYLSEHEIGEFIDKTVRDFEASPYTTLSTRIQYFYKIIKLAQAQNVNNIPDSIDICLDIINLLKRSKAVSKTERYGFIYANLSQCLLLQRSFEKAARAARESQIYFPHGSLNYIIAKEQEFFACFYMKNYSRCREALDVMLGYNKKDTGKLRLDKYVYFSGCLDFAEGKFKESHLISNLFMQIQKDKARWDLGLRYLKIMSLIELGETEDARNAIESLRKQLERSKDGDKVSKRDQLIYKALSEFRNLNFEATSFRLNYILKKLGFKETELTWKFHTHEIIPVHKWMLKRIKGKPVVGPPAAKSGIESSLS